MVPFNYQEFINIVMEQVNSGSISHDRIDDAVRRILRVKFTAGLFEKPYADRSLLGMVGNQEHRNVAREAVRKSLVLLKNGNGEADRVLPLSKTASKILVAGSHANDIGLQCGGWTIGWQGSPGAITVGKYNVCLFTICELVVCYCIVYAIIYKVCIYQNQLNV